MTLTFHEPNTPCQNGISVGPLRAGPALTPEIAASIRRSMILDFCKWDPQIGDVSTIAPFSLLMSEQDWTHLSDSAEALAAETADAEQELLGRPELHPILAVPRSLRTALQKTTRGDVRTAAIRVMRFDFHWTTDGWHVSEVNSDVPGGFAEASSLPMLMSCQLSPKLRPAGDPAGDLARALFAVSGGKAVVLLAAAGFIEDQQVTAYLARRLAEYGATACLAGPRQLEWRGGQCILHQTSAQFDVGAIFRFYQAEWLCRLPRRCWMPFFSEIRPVISNPISAALTESKRFPLVWDALKVSLPTWRRLLPESRNPRECAMAQGRRLGAQNSLLQHWRFRRRSRLDSRASMAIDQPKRPALPTTVGRAVRISYAPARNTMGGNVSVHRRLHGRRTGRRRICPAFTRTRDRLSSYRCGATD